MKTTSQKIAAALEQTFSEQGFAQPGVDSLKEAAGVSLRTLYKYYPSRIHMIHGALSLRHERYMATLFSDIHTTGEAALLYVFDQVAHWMTHNAQTGCLFLSAVAAYPNEPMLKELLERHKAEIAENMLKVSGLNEVGHDLLLIHEGLMHSWPVCQDSALDAAKFWLTKLYRESQIG